MTLARSHPWGTSHFHPHGAKFKVGRPGIVTRFSEPQVHLGDVLATELWCELTASEQAVKSPAAAVKIKELQNILPVARVGKKKR